MKFDKPKVTIDLEEYQYLKSVVDGFNKDDELLMAKEIISILALRHPGLTEALNVLERGGIQFNFSVRNLFSVGNDIDPATINFKRIKRNDKR